ncbi:MAG: DUF2358 domain-containing protein, partial [Thermosynechococcaceae cyanobacterium]
MDIIEALKADYARFPRHQTYELYAQNVQFKDPWIAFQGVGLYRKMIQFIEKFFLEVQMDLHGIERSGDQIQTQWTLSWIAPAPWKPRLQITGRSELILNAEGLIQSHI